MESYTERLGVRYVVFVYMIGTCILSSTNIKHYQIQISCGQDVHVHILSCNKRAGSSTDNRNLVILPTPS